MLLTLSSVFLPGCWGWPWCRLLRGGHVGAGSVFASGVGTAC